MAISGVVVVLSSDPGVSREALRVLSEDPSIELGSPQGVRVPAVIESPQGTSGSQDWERLREIPGIDEVHLAFATCEPHEEGDSLS